MAKNGEKTQKTAKYDKTHKTNRESPAPLTNPRKTRTKPKNLILPKPRPPAISTA